MAPDVSLVLPPRLWTTGVVFINNSVVTRRDTCAPDASTEYLGCFVVEDGDLADVVPVLPRRLG